MNDKSYIPEVFKFGHEYCFFLHDQLVETLQSAEKASIFNSTIKFNDESHSQAIEGLSGDEFIDWLEKNGYKGNVIDLYYKQLCAALLSDFLHFIFESLQCSRKGKLTVAYALLRKPLKENLFYMEWLLARPDDFLARFEKAEKNRFRLPDPEASCESDHIAIIREAAESTNAGLWIEAEFLHELRYKKNSLVSLEPAWQKATHLVTTFRHLETEECNLNFIFSDSNARYSQWSGYYQFVPILLFHAVEVIEGLLNRFAKREHHEVDIMPLRNIAGMMLYWESSPLGSDMTESMDSFGVVLKQAKLCCQNCGCAFEFHRDNISMLYSDGSLSCEHGCGVTSLHQ